MSEGPRSASVRCDEQILVRDFASIASIALTLEELNSAWSVYVDSVVASLSDETMDLLRQTYLVNKLNMTRD